VPQLLSILQNEEMMSANNLVLDPNNPLSMYKPQDNQLGEALSSSTPLTKFSIELPKRTSTGYSYQDCLLQLSCIGIPSSH
jgi:hypothetical protein